MIEKQKIEIKFHKSVKSIQTHIQSKPTTFTTLFSSFNTMAATTNSVFVQAILDCVSERQHEVLSFLAKEYGFDVEDAQRRISEVASLDSLEIAKPIPKKRGRPAKKVEVQEVTDEEDLVSQLMANSDAKADKPKKAKKPKMTPEEREAKKAETKAQREQKAAEAKAEKARLREEAKAQKLAEKEAAKEAARLKREEEKAERKRAKEAEKEAAKKAKQAEKEAKKAARFEEFKKQKAEKKAAKQAEKEESQDEVVEVVIEQTEEEVVEDVIEQTEEEVVETQQLPSQILSQIPSDVATEEAESELVEEEESDDDGEVTEFVHEGETYYRDDEGLVYDKLEDAEVVGTWNPVSRTIDPVATDDDEEEEQE